MIRNTLYIFLMLIISTACSTGQNKTAENVNSSDNESVNFGDAQENGIIGKWINSTIDVDLETYNNSDTSFHVAINEDNWEIKMNIKPVETFLREDGTFQNNYLDTLGNIFHSNSGIWYLDGDSLFLEDENDEIYSFRVIVKGDVMEMHTVVDYDDDGKKDDQYFGTYKKIKD